MKVVMLQDVAGVGQRGKVVEVSDGYALNFLIPHRKAEQATPQKEAEALKKIETESALRGKREAALVADIQSLGGAEIACEVRASGKGGLFKAITSAGISRLIQEQRSVAIPESVIQLDKPIKEVGDHTILLKKDKVAAELRLVVKSE